MSDPDLTRAAELLHLRRNEPAKGDPIVPPLVLSSMFHLPGDPAGHAQYGRMHNPTIEELEHALGHLEGADTIAFPSGMAAISAALLAVVSAGDRVLIPSDGYYSTRRLCDQLVARFGVQVEQRATARFTGGGFAGFRLVFVESPSNPGLDVVDLEQVVRDVHDGGGILVVDNTLMTPLGQRALDLGADVVVAADTKAPGGHSDVLLGHVATRDGALLEGVREWRTLAGAVPGPFEAWLGTRSLATLELRFDRMCTTAETIAPRLAAHPAVRAVRYPGLPNDPAHALATKQLQRFGFLIGLTLASEDHAERFIDACPLLAAATSFGGVHSTAERRSRWGDDVDPGFVRLSVGCEPTEELWAALRDAL